MEATRSLTTSSRRRGPLPAFYQPSSSSTSAQIIAEARQSLRVLPSERPFTPAESNRMLFGTKRTTSRPPSVYSIGACNFTASRPSTAHKLEPIETALAAQHVGEEWDKPTPPTPVQSICLLPQSHSLSAVEDDSSVLIPRPPSHTGLRSGISDQGSPATGRRVTSADHVTRAKRIAEDNLRRREKEQREDGERNTNGKRRDHRRSSEPLQITGTNPHSRENKSKKAAVKRKSEPPSFWQTEITPLLSQLSLVSTSPLDPEDVRRVVDELFQRLKQRECCSRTGGVAGVKQRSAVLRVIFSLLDSPDPSLLVKLANIIMAMEVTGKNLLNVCKLLFSLARTDANDCYLSEEGIAAPLLGLLSTCDVVSDSEVLVYGVGTVKLLASNSDLRVQLIEGDVLPFLTSLLQRYCQQKGAEKDAQLTGIQNVLVQLTAALRNLSEESSLRSSFLSSSVLPLLAVILSEHLSQPDIIFNITRLLSKLTLHEDCCLAVLQCPSFLPLLLQSLTVHQSHPDILIRVCFILGNLTTEDQATRQELFTTHHALPCLTSLMSSSLANELAKVKDGECQTEKSQTEELLIKLVRLLANLSVNEEVGRAMASDKTIVDQLMTVLSSLPLTHYCELTVNTLATLNNLSFHALQSSYLLHTQQHISRSLVRVLLEDDGGPLLECVRCYGNLSRHPAVRHTMAEAKVDDLLITLLDSNRHELVYACCGVLVNLMVDASHRNSLTSCGGVSKLVDILRDFGSSDWQLSSLVCQTLWNFSEGMTSSLSCFGQEVDRLLDMLNAYLEPPESLEEEWRDYFVPVGTSLLDRILCHHTQLLPLDTDHCS